MSQPETELRISSNLIYFDTLPFEIFSAIIKYVLMDWPEESSILEYRYGPLMREERIRALSLLVYNDSPFRDVVS